MASWGEFEQASPGLAVFGKKLFESGAGYLATVRRDGSPRLHPVTPVLVGGHLLLRVEPTSPKRHDLRGDGRYALHATVSDPDGTSGEFVVEGLALEVEDPAVKALAPPEDTYNLLFELHVHFAFFTTYENDQPHRRLWRQP